MVDDPRALLSNPAWKQGIAMWASSVGLSISQCEFQHGRNRRRASESQRFDNFVAQSLLQETQILRNEDRKVTESLAVREGRAGAPLADRKEKQAIREKISRTRSCPSAVPCLMHFKSKGSSLV